MPSVYNERPWLFTIFFHIVKTNSLLRLLVCDKIIRNLYLTELETGFKGNTPNSNINSNIFMHITHTKIYKKTSINPQIIKQ